MGIVYMTWQGYDALSYPMTTWGYSWLAMFYTCVLLLAVSRRGGRFSRMLEKDWLMRLGKLAYCSYLVLVAFMNAIRHPLKAHFPEYPVGAWREGFWGACSPWGWHGCPTGISSSRCSGGSARIRIRVRCRAAPYPRPGLPARPENSGAPHAPAASSAPNRTTASRLARPSFAQYTSRRFNQRANSSSVRAAPTP